VEVNLLVEKEDQKALAKVRRGCTLPFLGAGLFLITVEAVRATLV
jgi:hypothetical protein